MTKYTKLLSAILVVGSLASCDNATKKSLGITRSAPNEYSVLKQPPLSVPPTFELSPPSDETTSVAPAKKDNKVQLNKKKSSAVKPIKEVMTNADKNFLKKSTAHEKRTDIRSTLVAEEVKARAEEKAIEKDSSSSAWKTVKGWFN